MDTERLWSLIGRVERASGRTSIEEHQLVKTGKNVALRMFGFNSRLTVCPAVEAEITLLSLLREQPVNFLSDLIPYIL